MSGHIAFTSLHQPFRAHLPWGEGKLNKPEPDEVEDHTTMQLFRPEPDEVEDHTTMPKQCFSPEFHPMNNLLWHTVLLVLLLGSHVCASQDSNTILLNSCERCVGNVEYEVTADREYLVTVSSSASTSCSWECPARVYLSNNSSWLCIAQVGIVSQINDTNGVLSVYDSQTTDNAIFHVKYYHNVWPHREACTKTDFVDFYLRRLKSKVKLNFEKLRINFQVLDIASTNRKVYLDTSYCDTVYKLLNSRISIYNQPDEAEAVTFDQTLISLCGIPIEMVESEDTNNKRICFYYIPSDNVNCSSNWNFSVSAVDYSLKPSDMIYSLACTQNRSQETHAWCADPGIRRVTVIFQRNSGILKSDEHPHMFRFLVLDYNGSADSLMAEITNVVKELHKPPQDEVIDNNKIVVICILVTIAVAVLIIVAVFLYSRRGCLSRWLYGPVHNTGNAADC